MSSLSENLDVCDQSFCDLQSKASSNFSLHSNLDVVEDSPTEEEDESDEVTKSEEEETEGGKGTKRLVLEENPLESFRSSLWSNNESTIVRSVDSWDLPVGPVPWDDNDKPMQKLLCYADLALTEEEENGLLTDRIIAACSSYLTESPGNKCHVVAKVSLNNKNLNNIRILGCHRFLQYVDLSWNNLRDLTPLGCLPYLMYLDVSHNLMEEVLQFRPPLNLTYVNYSYNEVWQIDDLTDFWSLSYLDLSHNKISKIQGFHNLRYLRHLDLSHNKIERLENLNGLRLTDLNLEYNLISRFEIEQGLGMKTMPHLTNLHLNNNLIVSLEFMQDMYSLKKLELQANNVSDLAELSHMKRLKNLRYLDMSGNPVSCLKPYRSVLLNFFQNLKFLDQTEVDISERVAACNRGRFDVQLEAARNNARMRLLEQLNATSLMTDMDVLPIDQGPYPFVILVGPSASSKKTIIVKLKDKYPDKIHIGKLHTTREIFELEKILFVHISRECFNEAIKDGKFLSVSENLGHLYGFSKEELGTAIKERKVCLAAMDMVSALTIHSYGIQPFLVLALPHSREEHMSRLKNIYGPVLCNLGVIYISQRQEIHTHESNVERIQIIMQDLLQVVTEKISQSSLSLEGDGEPLDSDDIKSVFKGKSSISESESDENQLNRICYKASRSGYQCSPTRCGYESYKNEIGSFTCKPNERFSASLAEGKGEMTTTTSYSISVSPLIKTEHPSTEGNSFGEADPFLNWSMPFIDWSEINLDQMELEEAAKVISEKYLENVMSTSDMYQNLHLENPGLFSLSISTDDVEKALNDIGKYLKEIWRSTPNRKPIFDMKQDPVYQEYVPRKLEQLKEMLRKDFLSADGDGTLKGLNDVAVINSPASICAEMRLKGYGDFSENL